jgi:AcrR family transcriptional regulator
LIAAIAQTSPKLRDAQRSRDTLLDAAETLFSQRGYDGVSLSEIAAAAELSRGAPNYFFGSKDQLYRSVLERVFADRQSATARAVAPVVQWCEREGDVDSLRRALAAGMEGYMRFLLQRPAFGRFIAWEELAGGHRLQEVNRDSTALTDAFTRVKAVARRRGLRQFRVQDAVLLFVALTFAPLAHQHTLLVSLDRDLANPQIRRRHVKLAVDQMMHLLAREPS